MSFMDEFHDGDTVTGVKAYNSEKDQGHDPISPESVLEIYSNNPSDVIFKQLFELRMKQMKQGVDLSCLNRFQWGLAPLKFSDNIVLKESCCKEIPVMFQVTVCSACSPPEEFTAAYLGLYGDQESALLVSDVHEILNGRYSKLSILRREDAMFFHHLTARLFDENEGVLLPAEPVLSVLEKLRIESASSAASVAEALEEKKRKRSTSIDILIQSSLYLSMTSRESFSSGDEAESKDENRGGDRNNAEQGGEEFKGGGEKEATGEVDRYDESRIFSSSSNYHNHAPFTVSTSFPTIRSHSPLSEGTYTMTSMESRSMHISDSDADSSVFDDPMNAMATAAAAHSALCTFSAPNSNNNTRVQSPYQSRSMDSTYSDLQPVSSDDREWDTSRRQEERNVPQQQQQQHLTASYFDTPEELPRTRRSNRPRANTFSVSSQRQSSQSLFDAEAERTPLGMVTWLASLEEDDFVAAKLLSELSAKNKEFEIYDPSSCDIPKYRGFRSSKERDLATVLSEVQKRRAVDLEPPVQRRRRANSVIEVNRQIKGDSPIFDEGSFDHGSGIGSGSRNPRTYRKDPNWASEGRSRGYVGAYAPAERRRRIERFLEKRRLRVWQKNVKYDVRKNFADSRVRVKGRFVKKEDQIALIALGIHPIVRVRERNGSNSDFSCEGGDKLKDRDSDAANNGLCVDELDLDDDDDNDNDNDDDDIDNSGGRDKDTDRESQDGIHFGRKSVKQTADIGGSNSNSHSIAMHILPQGNLPQGHLPQGNGTEVVGLGRTRRLTQSISLIQRDR